jgi:predicted CXXCH cytochrome family protein
MQILRSRVTALSPAWIRGLTLAGGVAGVLLVAISCTTVNRAVVVVPNVPGASYIGSAECEMCHDILYRDFATAQHAQLIAAGKNAVNVGCESCHGPGSLHAESGGEVKPPFSFTSGRPPSGMASAFPAVPTPRSDEGICYQCHLETRGQFQLASHHPVPEGRLTCWECHPPHKGNAHAGGGTALLSENAACLKCHPDQRGPYVFEHEAMREGCTACHQPHGSVNAKMLRLRDSTLCLQCHQQRVQGGRILIGGSDHSLRVQQGGCWTAGCHEAVHGSRVSPSLRF